jgi:PPOX class probable FMN-dependent enzyme
MNPPWFPLYMAAYHRNRKDRAVQVATVSLDGLPEVRTVILRGVSAAGEPYFFSDSRSNKTIALNENPTVEMCCWWRSTSEQFRLRGEVTLVTSSEGEWGKRRQELWLSQGEDNRALFLSVAPGSPLIKIKERIADEKIAPEQFILVLLNVLHVDYLRLARPHERRKFWLQDGVWQTAEVTP